MPIQRMYPGVDAIRGPAPIGPPQPIKPPEAGGGVTDPPEYGGGGGMTAPPGPGGTPTAQMDPRRRQLMMDRLRGWAQGQRAQPRGPSVMGGDGTQPLTQVAPTPGAGPGIVHGQLDMLQQERQLDMLQQERPLYRDPLAWTGGGGKPKDDGSVTVMPKPGMPQVMPKPGFGNKPMMLPPGKY